VGGGRWKMCVQMTVGMMVFPQWLDTEWFGRAEYLVVRSGVMLDLVAVADVFVVMRTIPLLVFRKVGWSFEMVCWWGQS
jgi:hypothetical protein